MASDNDPTIYIQVAPREGPVSPEGASDEFVKATENTLRDVANLIRTSWSKMIIDIKVMPNPPSEITIKFGVDVGAEGGVPFIAKGSVGANFSVSIVWKREGD